MESQARWHINYGHYLIEVGKYLEALENYDTAFDLTSTSSTIIDVLSAQANLLALYLDSKEQAIIVYHYIETNFPEKAQFAMYRQGLLLYEMKRFQLSKEILNKYMKQYPQGRFLYQAEAILHKIKSKVLPPAYHIAKHPSVRIRLRKKVRKLSIDSQPDSHICVNNTYCKSTINIESSKNTLWINGKTMKGREILLTSQSPMRLVSGKYDKTVRGSIKIFIQEGRLTAINIIDIESYLYSVVPSESYPSWPIETLKAQAIAARTYALYQIEHRKKWTYDMVDNEGDQVYSGVNREHSKCTKAVNETKGMVLMQNNRPILAMYSANSGGFTASAKAIFNTHKSYLIAQKDTYSLKGKMAYWRRSFSGNQIETKLKKVGIHCHGIKTIRAKSFGPSGRVLRAEIVDKNGSQIIRTRTTLKRALKLPEILFEIKKKGREFVFDGNGFGHGVGYSQWGGAIMGDRYSYSEILKFYYPGSELINIW
jgi:stage II sporulation protein D